MKKKRLRFAMLQTLFFRPVAGKNATFWDSVPDQEIIAMWRYYSEGAGHLKDMRRWLLSLKGGEL